MPLPPYKRPKHIPFVAPRAIRRLPFNLNRTHLYPRYPERAAAAVQEYFRYMDGAPMPMLLPQRMGFQQWKTPRYGPVGEDGVFGGRGDALRSAKSFTTMTEGYEHGIPRRVADIAPQPVFNPILHAAASRGMNMMPQPPTQLTPVVARSVRMDDATSTMTGRAEPPPSAWAVANEVTQLRHRRVKLLQREAALVGARSAVVRSRGFVRR